MKYFSNQKTTKSLRNKLKSFLGFSPKNITLYILALKHKSLLGSNTEEKNSERLEFLGDSILNSIVSEYLYHKFPKEDQGFLSENKSKIISNNTLKIFATQNQTFSDLIQFESGKHSKKAEADTLEAIIGAVFLDYNYKKAKHFIHKKILSSYIEPKKISEKIHNYKGDILNWGDKYKKEINFVHTEYNEDKIEKKYKVLLRIDGNIEAQAFGPSKKIAEQNVAELFHKKNIT